MQVRSERFVENYTGLLPLLVKMVLKCKARAGYAKVGADSGSKSEWGELVAVNYSLGSAPLRRRPWRTRLPKVLRRTSRRCLE
uniref:Uncharacterized protein n=1 Tax=Physcomitrium patens TaxID=3218 RepID=A0A2K1KT07_PHYPA|nr:hypothetical protein PHYPA_003925 [Physcomitrium patens]